MKGTEGLLRAPLHPQKLEVRNRGLDGLGFRQGQARFADGPGVVRTELWEQLDKDLVEIGMFDKEGQSMDHLAATMITMKRYSYPDDVKGTAAFLCSDESDYMTGQVILIDGGMILQ